MKQLLGIVFLCAITSWVTAQKKVINTSVPDSTKKIEIVEAACGQCQFHLPGKSCDLAVRIKGKAYFIDNATIDAYGDAHATNGFCNAISKAAVQGTIVNDRFVVSYFKLVSPLPKKQ
jgi:Family of unknown function (DUF6370)